MYQAVNFNHSVTKQGARAFTARLCSRLSVQPWRLPTRRNTGCAGVTAGFTPTPGLPGSKGSFVQAGLGLPGISFLHLYSYKGTHTAVQTTQEEDWFLSRTLPGVTAGLVSVFKPMAVLMMRVRGQTP